MFKARIRVDGMILETFSPKSVNLDLKYSHSCTTNSHDIRIQEKRKYFWQYAAKID
jgi:hypothetical protein